jgi:cytochrome oxidase Cu insertion factor (SCO1/SenC/PrrC family)
MSRLLVWFFCLSLALLSLGGCRITPQSSRTNLDLGAVPDFHLTDQKDRPLSRDDLRGKVWVASFIFTRCATLCPQVSASMAELQKELPAQGVMLLSFSVDPTHDTPKVLQEYAHRFGADPERWRFLTGDETKMYKLIREGFFLAVEQNQGTARTKGNEVTHSPRLVVVDKQGHIRGLFDGRKVNEQGQPVNELPQVRQLVDELLREKS